MYHEGEIAIQARVGVRTEAERIGNVLTPFISELAQDFLRLQPMLVASTIDAQGHVWTSLLTGEPGFARAVDASAIEIEALPRAGDPLTENLHPGAPLGMIAVDTLNRKRLRVNGSVGAFTDECIHVHTKQVYFNCPKYIQRRTITTRKADEQAPRVEHARVLNERQQAWIRGADTFFIGSVHPDYGVDASHRGGRPGFVHIIGPDLLLFPDYKGNMMFQTLGNLVVDSRAGLLFIDFERGGTLQLTGKASIIWDEKIIASIPGAKRVLLFEVAGVVEIGPNGSIHGDLLGYSPFNPS